MKKISTTPLFDFQEIIPPKPKVHKVYSRVLDHWQSEPGFIDIDFCTPGRLEVRFCIGAKDGLVTDMISYPSCLQYDLNPETGMLCWYLPADLANCSWEHLCAKAHIEYINQPTPLRGFQIVNELFWAYTPETIEELKILHQQWISLEKSIMNLQNQTGG